MSARVSVIIPTYNRAATVCRAVDSVLAQDVSCDVIVVDDGSTDDTRQRLAAYGDRIRVLHKPNGGVASARNAGLAVAMGELVAFLDSDDEWLPGTLAPRIATLDADPALAMVSGNAEYVDIMGRVEARGSASLSGNAPESVVAQLLLQNVIVTSTVVVRRAAIEELTPAFLGEFSPSEDWILWLRVAARHPIAVMPDVVARYHVTHDSITRTAPASRIRRAYAGVHLLEKIDPFVRPVIARNRRGIRMGEIFWTSCAYYDNGQAWRARVSMVRAIAIAPWLVRWKTALAILFLPRRLRDSLKRRLT